MANSEWLPSSASHVLVVPDSLFAPALRPISRAENYLLFNNESQAIGVAIGLVLAGFRPLVVMENSGLRESCEAIARTAVLHQIQLTLLLSPRGDQQDKNWWAANNARDTDVLLDMLRIRRAPVGRLEELSGAIDQALELAARRISSTAVLPSRATLAGIS